MGKRCKWLASLLLLLIGSIFAYQSAALAANEDDITGIQLEKEMRELIQLEVLKGYGNGEYRPFEKISRGQFAAFIARALDLPEGEHAFPDVPQTATLANEINRAAAAGIVNGYPDKTFRMNELVTREQMAQMIHNALLYKDVERTEAELQFTDLEEIYEPFIAAVASNVHDEIIKGFPNVDGTYRFAPKEKADRAQAAAFIARMLKVLDDGTPNEDPGEDPGDEPGEEPGPSKEGFVVASIDGNKKLVPGTVVYETFEEAKNAVKNANEVVTYNGKIVSMSAGVVISAPPEGKAVTYIYADKQLNNRITYINSDQEMEYVEATKDYVKANLAGMPVYVAHEEVYLLPYQMLEGRTYYTVAGGDLIHHVYSQKTKTAPYYVAGKAPSFLKEGQKYYSWDGATFYNEAGEQVGTAYQYFNYLSLRTETSYTAEELDQFIDYMLEDRERLYNSNPERYARYEDVMNRSKLKGLGEALKAVEEKYRINALYILSIAFNESDYGMSEIAQTKNNLFGLNAVDSDVGLAYSFDSPEASIEGLVEKTIIAKYLNLERTFYANGAAFGNKSVGMNVVYASDPYWGQKNAGYMYRADKYLGGRDYGMYQLGLTTAPNLNVRSLPDPSATKYFSYPKSGMPVAIIGSEQNQQTNETWYKVVSEQFENREAYIHSAFVKLLPIVE